MVIKFLGKGALKTSCFKNFRELRDITNYIRSAVLGITKSKLDSSVMNAEVIKY